MDISQRDLALLVLFGGLRMPLFIASRAWLLPNPSLRRLKELECVIIEACSCLALGGLV